jgi:(2Fe-2S) ferredoxin
MNQRDAGRQCCNDAGATSMKDYAKQRIKQLGLDGPGGVRVNMAGCLGRCAEGPILVIYPDEVWYTYETQQDIDEIIDSHIINGKVVEHLRLPSAVLITPDDVLKS